MDRTLTLPIKVRKEPEQTSVPVSTQKSTKTTAMNGDVIDT